MKARWRQLLSPLRVKVDGETISFDAYRRQGDARSPFEIDYERVVFSSSFRRLARKTQVHPFADVDYVHNRLTHSLEVSALCQTFAREIQAFLVEKGDLDPELADAVGWSMKAAGLAHDIGNPAYGHSGEEAIQAWAEKASPRLGDDLVWTDFRVFDGNAQAFRLLARNDLRSSIYYCFTLASLGALVKHPRLASSFASDSTGKRKLSAFSTEEEIFRRVWAELGLVRPDGSFMRHPLSYLTEAADDICYRILDFEDAVSMDIFPERQVCEIFRKVLSPRHQAESVGKPVQWFRGVAIGDLIEAFVDQFKRHYDEIMSGTFEGELKDYLEGDQKAAFGDIRDLYGILFSHHRKVIAEIGSYGQFSGILDRYLAFLEQIPRQGPAPQFNALSTFGRQLVQLAWDADYYEANRSQTRAWWAHQVLDFVSGMTDDYLNTLSPRLSC